MRVIVPPDIGDYAEEQLATLANVALMPHTAVHPAMGKTDVAHRPYQVSNANDLLMLRMRGGADRDHPPGSDRLPQSRLFPGLSRSGSATSA